MSRLSVILTILLCSILAQFSVAAEIGTHNYDIYVGDINNDGDSDFYFHGKPLTLILHGDIATPILLRPASLAIMALSDGYSNPQLFSLTNDQLIAMLSSGALRLARTDIDYIAWNTSDGSGRMLFLRGETSANTGLLIRSYSNAELPSLISVYPSNTYPELNDKFRALRVVDINDDGFLDLVVGDGQGQGEIAYLANNQQVPSVYFESIASNTQPVIHDATLVGATAGQFRVDESGAATYNVPLSLTEGVAGVTPQLALSYTSQAGIGLLGKGWSIAGLSSITRCRQTLYQDGSAKPLSWGIADRFCLDGQRLIVVSGSYGAVGSTYKTEIDAFVIVSAVGGTDGHPNYFTVKAKDGSTTTYGGAANAKMMGSAATPTTVFGWAISRFEDNVKNGIDYVYEGDATTGHRIKTIHYAFPSINQAATLAPRTDSNARVTFEYATRPDISSGFMGGYEFKQTGRLKNIKVINGNTELRNYSLSYMDETTTTSRYKNKISRLEYIQECRASNSCLPPLKFSWGGGTHIMFNAAIDQNVSFSDTTAGKYLMNQLPTDITGDGKLDLIYLLYDREKAWVYVKKADSNSQSIVKSFSNYNDIKISNLDYNADGRQDLAIYNGTKWNIYLSYPKSDGTWAIDSSSFEIDPGLTDKDTAFVDFNSDGLADAITAASYRLLSRDTTQAITSRRAYSFSTDTSSIPKKSGVIAWDSAANFPGLIQQNLPFSCDAPTYSYKILPDTAADFNSDGIMEFIGKATETRLNCAVPGAPTRQKIENSYYYALNYRDGKMRAYGSQMSLASIVYPVDVNGDALPDLVYADSTNKHFYKLNTGTGFNNAVEWVTLPKYTSDPKFAKPQFLDFDGDGATDIAWHDRSALKLKVRLWSGSTLDVTNTYNGGATDSHLLMDVSGDGIYDYINISSTGFYGRKGAMAVTGQPVCQYLSIPYSNPTEYRCVMVAPDVAVPSSQQSNSIISIENGMGNQTKISYGTLATAETGGTKHYKTTDLNLVVTSGVYVANCPTVEGRPQCPPTVSYTSTNSDDFYARLNGGWDLPAGSITLESNNATKGAPVLEVNGPIQIVTSVESSAPTAGASPSNVNYNSFSKVSYFYAEAKMQASGRGFLGFAKLTTVDAQSGFTTATTYRQDFPFIGSPLETIVYASGSADAKVLSHSSNTWNFASGANGARYYQPQLQNTLEKAYDLNTTSASNPLQTISTDSVYDAFGNPTSIITTTSGKKPNGADTKLVQETVNIFGNIGAEEFQRFGRLTSTSVKTTRDSEPSQTRTSTFTYHPQNGEKNFLLESETINGGPSTWYDYDSFGNKIRVTSKALNHRGILEERNTINHYSTNGRYLEYSENDLQQRASVTQRNEYGSVVQGQDSNSLGSQTFYDDLGREYMRKEDSGAWSRTDLSYCNSGNGVACPTGAVYRSQTKLAGGSKSTDYFDVLGRVIRNSKITLNGQVSNVDTEYDSLSRVRRQSIPFFGDTAALATDWDETQYDLIGRPIEVLQADGTKTTSSYLGHTNTVTNHLGHYRVETRNAFGQLSYVRDADNGIIQYTYDLHGGLTTATTSAQGKSFSVRMCYDSLGRKTAMLDPDKGATRAAAGDTTLACESVNWGRAGWWHYRYSGFGELIEQRDPKGQTVKMAYDQLGRMVGRTDILASGAIEGFTQWFYERDVNNNSVGINNKLTAVVMNTATNLTQAAIDSALNSGIASCSETSSSCYKTVHSFDVLSRPDSVAQTFPGSAQVYKSRTEYDFFGRVSRQYDALDKIITQNGSLLTSGVKTLYNAYGYAEKLTDIGSGSTLQQTETVNARNQVVSEWRGGAKTTNAYDPINGNLLSQRAGIGSLTSIQNIEYRWDKIGNLLYRNNQSPRLTGGIKNLKESFCYDRLNRLIKTVAGEATTTPACTGTQDIYYDGLGNIGSKLGVGTYSYSGINAGPHAVTNAGGAIYEYDANGNATLGDSRNFLYTSYDMASRITRGSDYIEFKYGPDRARWKRTDVKGSTKTETLYLGNVERIKVDDTNTTVKTPVEWKRNVAGVIFTYKTNDAHQLQAAIDKAFVYKDHLGSVDVITDSVGTLRHSMSFNPWGARRAGETWTAQTVAQVIDGLRLTGFTQPITTRGYTGHEMLDDMGIIHMNGRIYDPKIARFLQADPFIQAATNTQSYNRYSYLLNNPLNATDPSGFFLKKLYRAIMKLNGSWAIHKFLARHVPGLVPFIQAALNFIPGVGPLVSAAFGAEHTFYLKGSITQSIKSFAISYGSSVIGGNIGSSGLKATQIVFAQAMVGGVMAELQGGKFGHGFVSAGLSAAAGAATGSGFSAQGMLVSAIVGGTVSEMTGGKFASGAQSAATMYAVMWAGSKIGAGGATPEVKSESSGISCSANPINIATGEKYLTMTDYRAEGASQMTFQRFYSSYAKEKTSLGIGWRSNFDRSLKLEKIGDTTLLVVAIRQQGDPIQFDRVFDEGNLENDQWVTSDNRYEILRKTESGWELQLTDNTIESYDESGRLVSIKEVNGYQQSLVYGNQGLTKNVLLSVTDNFGQQLLFTYDIYARISSMTATDGSVTRYQYDTLHNLTKVISPDETAENDWDNQFVVYDYNEERFAHAITGIRNSQGQRIHSMAYDEQGRAVLSALGDDAERVDIAFTRGDNQTKQSVVKNSLGKTTTYTFDADNKPLLVEGNPTAFCIGSNESYEYNDKDQLISKTDWNGSTTHYQYNDRGLETSRIEAVGTAQERHIATQWHDQWRLPTRVASAELVVEFAYNEHGLLERRVERDIKSVLTTWQKLFKQYPEREWNYGYTEQGLLAEVDGPRTDVNDISHFEYNAQGNRTAVINALDHRSETLAFNERGLPLQVRDANGVVTELAYNPRGWLISKTVKTEQGDSVTRYAYAGVSDYNDQGVISAVTLPNGAEIHYEYDSARRLTAQSNNAGERIEYSLDLEGNRLEQRIVNSTGALLFNQQQVFDELSRLLQSIGADGSVTRFGYDKADNLISSIDALGNNTAYAYDALNRLIATTDAMDGVVQNAYDQANRVTAVTDQRGLVTQYHYDGFGNKVAQISPDTGETVYGYDQAGNLTSKKDARNVVTQYRYDAVGRIADVIYPAANDENIHYRYDSNKPGENGIGRVASMANASGTQAYRYNAGGQLAEQIYDIKGYDVGNTRYSVAYDYDRAGQLKTLRYPSGRAVGYRYDAQGRLSAVNTTHVANTIDDAAQQTLASNIHYLPFGSLKGLTYGNGAQLRIDHDQNYRTRSIRVGSFAANDALFDRHYDYDATSNITDITDRNNTFRSQVFNYDAIYRLTNATGSYGQVSYNYDAVGNRIAREQNGRMEAYSYADNSNRLLGVITESEQGDLQARSLSYDAVGNIVRDGVDGKTKQLNYSQNNRLQQVAITNKSASSYEYNAKGQRVIKRVNGQVIHFHYDINDQLIAETQASGQPIREYIYAAGQRLAMVDYTEKLTGVIYYMVNDHLGAPQLLLDAQQQVVWAVDQSPFGEVKIDGNVVQPLRFPGQYADIETGYSYNYFRDYDPTLGRYIQSDPIGLEGGVNTFGYVLGNPTRYLDFRGTDPEQVQNAFNRARANYPTLGSTARLSFNPIYMAYAGNNTAITFRLTTTSDPIIAYSFRATYGSISDSYLEQTGFHELIHADGLVARNFSSYNMPSGLADQDHALIAPLEDQYSGWLTFGDREGSPGKPDIDSLPWRQFCPAP